jgi:hypothetical protein
MWSDSIHTAIEALLSELTYYSKPPFNYSDEQLGKDKIITALALLYSIIHRLDMLSVSDESCREEAEVAYDLARRG